MGKYLTMTKEQIAGRWRQRICPACGCEVLMYGAQKRCPVCQAAHKLGHANDPAQRQKVIAGQLVARAVRRGELIRQPCQSIHPVSGKPCGKWPTHGHHEDYSKPLEVMWLCPLCHCFRHDKIKRAKAA